MCCLCTSHKKRQWLMMHTSLSLNLWHFFPLYGRSMCSLAPGVSDGSLVPERTVVTIYHCLATLPSHAPQSHSNLSGSSILNSDWLLCHVAMWLCGSGWDQVYVYVESVSDQGNAVLLPNLFYNLYNKLLV